MVVTAPEFYTVNGDGSRLEVEVFMPRGTTRGGAAVIVGRIIAAVRDIIEEGIEARIEVWPCYTAIYLFPVVLSPQCGDRDQLLKRIGDALRDDLAPG